MKARLIAITKPVIPECETAGDLIAYAARVSNPGNQANTLTAPKLLAYLMGHHHWSPFEMVSMTVELVTTRDIGRQVLRHRSFSFQEFSQRYAAVTAEPVRREARLQDTKNRQNSTTTNDVELQVWWDEQQMIVADETGHAYQNALNRGIAKEVARAVLAEGLTPTTMYMAGTIRSFIHYILERTSQGTQKEHRDLAERVADILYEQFPMLEIPMMDLRRGQGLSVPERIELEDLRFRMAGLSK